MDGSGYALRVMEPPRESFGNINGSTVTNSEPILFGIVHLVFQPDTIKCNSHFTCVVIRRGLLCTLDEVLNLLLRY